MKKRRTWRSLLAIALVVGMFASVLPFGAIAAEAEDSLTKTDTLTGGEVVITFTPSGENSKDVSVSGTNESGAQVGLSGSANTTSNSETAADGTVTETETTIVGMTGTETADGVKKDVTYDQTTVDTTITKPDGTVQESAVIDGKETKEWNVEEDSVGDAPVDVQLKPGDTVTGSAKVEGSETSGTTTLEDGTIVTESSYEVDRKVDATTSEITTGAEKTTTDMSPVITDIGIDYDTWGGTGKVRWDYHVAYDEDGNPVIFTSGKQLTNSLMAGEYDFYWYGEKPLSSSKYFDGITDSEGNLRLVPRVARTEEDMPDWLKSSGNYKKNSDGVWVPCSDLSRKEIIAGSSEDFEFAFSGYGGISSYGMLLESDGSYRWNERYFDEDGDGDIDLVWEPINNGRVTDKEGNVYFVYCLDADTGTLTGYTYNIENVQDVDYFSGSAEEQQMKKDQVTAIALNGFWGSENEGDLGNIDTIKSDLIKFLEETDTFSFTYTDPSAYMGGEAALADRTFTAADREEMIKLVALLDEGGALAVTQSALWEYGNRGTNDPVMVFDRTGVSDDPNVNYAMALYRAYLLSDELREQVKAEQENKATTIYDANTSFIAEESLKLTVGDKIEDLDLTENNDDDDTNDYYSNDLSFSLVVAPAQQDSLIVTLVDSNGTIISRARIAGAAGEDDGEISPSMLVRENNVYTFQNVPMQEGSNVTFDLKLEGVQHLEEGVYIYKASSDDFTDAQTMVGLAQGSHDVNASSSFTVNFNVEETNRVHSEAVWHREGDPTETPPEEILPPPPTEEIFEEDPPLKDTPEEEPPVEEIPEEDPPLVDIFEEEIPLADVPHTGDSSIYFVILAVLSAMGLAALALTRKREEV